MPHNSGYARFTSVLQERDRVDMGTNASAQVEPYAPKEVESTTIGSKAQRNLPTKVDSPKNVNYSVHMVEVIQSATFRAWLSGLRDRKAAARVTIRIERLAMGNPGDHHGVGGGIMELRLTYGPGYRVYYRHEGNTLVVLLAGGDKSTQSADIAKAKAVAAERDKDNGGDVQPL